MIQEIIQVNTFKKIIHCAVMECDGDYEFTGNIGSIKDIAYPNACEHKCNVCGDVQNFTSRFPEIVYKRV